MHVGTANEINKSITLVINNQSTYFQLYFLLILTATQDRLTRCVDIDKKCWVWSQFHFHLLYCGSQNKKQTLWQWKDEGFLHVVGHFCVYLHRIEVFLEVKGK